jgi:hypothetical protein
MTNEHLDVWCFSSTFAFPLTVPKSPSHQIPSERRLIISSIYECKLATLDLKNTKLEQTAIKQL